MPRPQALALGPLRYEAQRMTWLASGYNVSHELLYADYHSTDTRRHGPLGCLSDAGCREQ